MTKEGKGVVKMFLHCFIDMCIVLATQAIFHETVLAQSYDVTITAYSGSPQGSPKTYYISGAFGSLSSTDGSFNVSSLPTSFKVDFYNSFSFSTCTITGTITSSSICGAAGTGGSGSFCFGSTTSPSISLTASPKLLVSGTPSSNSTLTLCENQQVTLNGTSGFGNYTWYYKVQSGPWTGFTTNANFNATFGIQDVFGANYPQYLNQTIYFGYGISGCGVGAYLPSGYIFAPYPPFVGPTQGSDYIIINPTCSNGTGQLIVNALNRPLRPNEKIIVDLYDGQSLSDNILHQNLQPKTLPIILSGLAPGTYYAFVESYLYPDGGPANAKTPCVPATLVFKAITITAPPVLGASGSITSQVNCYGGSNGQIKITGSGGSGNFLYSINGGSSYQSSNIFSNLQAANNYAVKIRESNDTNCTAAGPTLDITSPTQVTPGGFSAIQPTCSGSSTGSISIGGSSGGVAPYVWSMGGTFQSEAIIFSGISPGAYSITVKDNNGCTVSAGTVVLNQPISASWTSTLASCLTVTDGSISIVSVSGGTGSFQYSLNGGAYQPSNLFSSLGGGNYSINVKDGNNCVYAISNAVVGLKTPVSGIITQTSFINCYGQSTAALTAGPSGGTPSYNYNWSNGSTSQSIGSLPAGNYSVTITDSKSCSASASIIISQPSQLSASASTSDFNGFNISCKGGSNSSINLTPSGGTPGYTYTWSTGATSQNVSGLAAGNCSVSVTDVKGCSISKSFTLTEPPSIVSVSLQSKNDVTCFGSNNGAITATASGGVGAISYSKDNWISSQSSATFSALPPATYTIYARDLNGCSANTSPITISSPTALTIPSIIKSNPLCNGDANGSLTMAASGGTTPYQFSKGGAFSSSNSFSGLVAGSYVLSVKDGNGCTASSSTQVLSEPATLVLSASTIPQSCVANIDGSIALTGTGGTPPYLFSTDGGTTYQSTNNFTGLASGIYSSALKDNHGCIATKPIAVNIQPLLSGNITLASPINCFGQATGGLSLAVSGGTLPYTYSWSNGSTTQNINGLLAGNYSVTIKDSRNCTASQGSVINQPTQLSLAATSSNYNGYGISCQNSTDGFINASANGGTSPYAYSWTTGATASTISGLSSGNYTVFVNDSKNCTTNLAVVLTAPAPLSLAIDSIINVTCNQGIDGSVIASALGGVTNYAYSLDGTKWQPSATFSSLSAALYIVQVRDGNACTTSTPVNVKQPLPISISIGTIEDAGCNLSNGSVQSSASGGTGTLNYVWKNAVSQTLSSSSNLVNVPSGLYSLTVTDQSQCTTSTTAAVSNPNGPTFSVVNQVATSCSYTNDGQATVQITTGPSPYNVHWSSGDVGISATGLTAGINTVIVTDGNNCSTIKNFTIVSPTAISLASQLSNRPSCPGGNDGSIQVVASGGTSPYRYVWNGNAGSSLLSKVVPGTYSLSVVDTNNCVYSQNIDVADVPPIVINVLNQNSPRCSSSADGNLFVLASGGNGSFTYTWSNGTIGAQLNSVAAGVYTVTALDGKNCTQQKTIDLIAPTLVAESLSTTAALCHGGNTGVINASLTGGVGGYTFSKDNGGTWQTQSVFEGLTAGNYSIIGKDQNGCSILSQAVVSEPPAITIAVSKTEPICGIANGSAQASVVGGTGTYRYQWSDGVGRSVAVSPNLSNAYSDVYSLKVVDDNNCSVTTGVTLAVYPSAQFSVTNVTSTSCSYLSDGKAEVQIASALAPYAIAWSNGETSNAASGLTAGFHAFTLTDANNCKFTKTFQVPSPLPISLTSETITNPACTGGTGSIQVTPSGGTGNFTYRWNGSLGTNSIQNVKAGSYNLTIKDGNGCVLPMKYALVDPPPFLISLGTDRIICPQATASIGLTLPNATYHWTGPDNFVSSQGNVNVATAGTYRLTVTNSDGCKASDDIIISIADNLLKADFLTATKAHVGDTLAIIDISWPVPDQVNWQVGEGATLLYADNDYALITFPIEGDFKIGLMATQAGCHDEYHQTVSVDNLPRGGAAKHETGEIEVSSLAAYPNPFSGRTNMKIELSESGKATLKVYSMVTNSLIVTHEFEGDKIYNAEIDFHGREAGLYIIIVESGSKAKAIRVIKL